MLRRKKDETEGEVVEFADIHFEAPNLEVPAPPADLPYDEYDDHNGISLLAVNGVAATEEAILQALQTQSGVVLAAAAHASGSLGIAATLPRLGELAGGPDDQVAVEAAYAMVRLGRDDGVQVLHQALALPVDAYLSPMLAANHLARLGDPVGYSVVRAALDSEFVSSRMLACKALLLFAPYDARNDAGGAPLDVAELYDRALHDPDPSIQGECLVQLRWAPPGLARPLLDRYLDEADDEVLRRCTEDALEHMPEG